jgi:hypothetical protein
MPLIGLHSSLASSILLSSIRYTIANGNVAPFVGHNAILRWPALQHVASVDQDGFEKFWSESHVPEDFDMQIGKVRYWCDELLFHQLRFWITHGPFIPLFRKFILSNVQYVSLPR